MNRIDRAIDAMDEITNQVPLVAAPEASGSGVTQPASLPTPIPDFRSRRTTVWTATPQWDTQSHQWYVICPHCTNDCGEAEKHMFCDFCGKNFDCEWETEAEEEQ